jgi:hypothetical protein
MSERSDLLALGDEALVMLANRGLVKRATKDIDKGNGPTVEVLGDGTVVGNFDDVTTTMAPGVPFKLTSCTCGAARACRHRVATVLAYQALHADPRPGERPPFDVSEDVLKARLGDAVYRAAARQRARGFSATVRYDDFPVVLLPTCTVTFLVPWDLAHARCDCVTSVDCEHVAMAAWALRASPSEDGEHLVALTDGADTVHGHDAIADLTDLAHELIRGGWSGALQGIEPRAAAVQAALRRRRLVWLDDLFESLLAAMRDNHAGLASTDPHACSHLLTELHMRCSARPSARAPRDHLHGQGVSGATKLDHVVLRGLGARYRISGRVGRLSVFFRERGSDDALVLERSWTVDEGNTPPPGPVMGRRRLVGTTVDVLATSNVTTRGATRRPNRVIDISKHRMQTSVMRGSGQRLEASEDYGALLEQLAARVPQAMGPRVRAWRVVVVSFGDVEDAGYDPGTRTVWGVLADKNGKHLIVTSEWHPEAPAGPGLLGRALTEGANFITAEAHLRRGTLWLEPLTIGFDAPLAVDLHPEVEIPRLPTAAVPLPEDPLAVLVESARAWLGDAARRGLAHLTHSQLTQGRDHAERLETAGLTSLGAVLRSVTSDGGRVLNWCAASTQAELAAHVLARTKVWRVAEGES